MSARAYSLSLPQRRALAHVVASESKAEPGVRALGSRFDISAERLCKLGLLYLERIPMEKCAPLPVWRVTPVGREVAAMFCSECFDSFFGRNRVTPSFDEPDVCQRCGALLL